LWQIGFLLVWNFHTKRKGCQQQVKRPELGLVAEVTEGGFIR
jgi:hypothetical protein